MENNTPGGVPSDMAQTPNESASATTDSTATPSPISSRRVGTVIVLCSVVLGIALIGVTYLYTESLKMRAPSDLSQEEQTYVWNPDEAIAFPDSPATSSPATSSSAEWAVDGPSYESTSPSNSLYRKIEESNVAAYTLEIDWLPRPVETDFSELPYSTEGSYYSNVYRVGTAKNGILANAPIYLVYESEMGQAFAGLYAIDERYAVKVTEWIPAISEQPQTLRDSVTGLTLTRNKYPSGTALLDLERLAAYDNSPIERLTLTSSTTIPDGALYRFKQCFFSRTPADLLVNYTVDIPFIRDIEKSAYGTPTISFTRVDGMRMSAEYEIYNRVNYGCGSLCSPLKVVERTDADFVKTGTTDDGFDVFVLKNSNDPLLTKLYNQPNTRAFIDTTSGNYVPLKQNKYTYEQFIGMAPVLFWKDPLGRWVHFVHSEFLVLAEKCKPVIYLYPETETDLHVEVTPNVAFTKTIPEYKDGWDVTAYPDGTIIDRESKQTYDYLYWTGWVEGYPLIEKGWVVATKDISAFFDAYLPKYGLVGKEIADFKDYWVGDLDEAPFYAISFVDQAIIDSLSPLSLDKAPDTIIRVLMTALPLQRPINLEAPILPETPARHGFTVAEWGGTVLRTE